MGTKPPAAVDGRISKDGRHDSDAAAPHSTTTSSLQRRAGGLAVTPGLVELVFGPGSTRRAEKQGSSTIGEGGDTAISTKQPLPGIGLHDPLHGQQICPEFIAFDQGVGQICPR